MSITGITPRSQASPPQVAPPRDRHATASPWNAALAGALLSPCSSADPMLARIFAGSASGQTAFVIAGQCLDVRQTQLLLRSYGLPRALIAWLCGALACAIASSLA